MFAINVSGRRRKTKMKEIKFRAWNEEKKDMIYSSRGNYVMEFDGSCSFITWGTKHFEPLPNLKLMQFIGLNDKNKKEIYEGDILLRECFEDIADVPIREYYIVEIKNQRFAHLIDNPKDWSDIFKSDEIIGNIYENLELLKGEKLI